MAGAFHQTMMQNVLDARRRCACPSRTIGGVSLASKSILWYAMIGCTYGTLQAATFDVGPGDSYTSIGDVPWESLAAGNWKAGGMVSPAETWTA
jgi:hypothetical protein